MGSVRARKDNGMLFLDFYYRGIRCREQTALTDTPANRKRVQKLLERIETEISLGTFDYARFFPGSRNARKFAASPLTMAGKALEQALHDSPPATSRPPSCGTSPRSGSPRNRWSGGIPIACRCAASSTEPSCHG